MPVHVELCLVGLPRRLDQRRAPPEERDRHVVRTRCNRKLDLQPLVDVFVRIVAAQPIPVRDDREALQLVIDDEFSAWPDKVEQYRAGNKNLIGMFVGEVMKATRGAGAPKTVRELITVSLDP